MDVAFHTIACVWIKHESLQPFSCLAAIGILVPLKDLCTIEGTKTVLETKISVQDIGSVKWYHNDQPLTASERVQMVVKGAKQRLVLTRTHASDEGHYKLMVGRADTSCRLTVQRKNNYCCGRNFSLCLQSC